MDRFTRLCQDQNISFGSLDAITSSLYFMVYEALKRRTLAVNSTMSLSLSLHSKKKEAHTNLVVLLFFICLPLLHRGYNIGVRLIEDFLARSSIGRCQDFRETADVIAKVIAKVTLVLQHLFITCFIINIQV